MGILGGRSERASSACHKCGEKLFYGILTAVAGSVMALLPHIWIPGQFRTYRHWKLLAVQVTDHRIHFVSFLII